MSMLSTREEDEEYERLCKKLEEEKLTDNKIEEREPPKSITLENIKQAIETIDECIALQKKMTLTEPDEYIIKQHSEIIEALEERADAYRLVMDSFDFLCNPKIL